MDGKKLFLRQVIHDSLHSKIINNQLMPGDRLIESRIGKEFGASRTPVRDALQELSDEGLAKYFPRKGYIVAKISMKEALDLYEIRRVLEGAVMENLARKAKDEEIQALIEILSDMKKNLELNDFDKTRILIQKWNETAIEAIKNPNLYDYITNNNDKLNRLWSYLYRFDDIIREVVAYISRMATLIEARNTEDIFNESRENIDKMYILMQEYKDPRIFYF